ncbi:MAG TPA: molybdate ABC transporter substrate-binding protein [Candidatus Sulfotelmatobacter sp.]|nr:molybdate ABC transporter substrate-binding protein [Candidatus Sulfotelmatobacter sp.]
MIAFGAIAPASADTDVVALIAAVAHPAMNDIIPAFERSHPGVKIQASYGGAQVLVAQVQAGAPVDLIMVGETALSPIASKIGSPVGVLGYHEVVLVPKGSKKIHGLRDLADPGVRVAFGVANSPPATYAHEVLAKASKGYGSDFERKVMANVATTKPSSAEIAAAVKNGLADAAIGFSSDVTDELEAIPVPAEDDVFTVSRGAVVNGAAHAAAAQAFLDYLRGSEAQALIRKHHLDPPR